MKCPNCGADSDNKFCGYCGAEMPYNGPEKVVNDNSQTTVINNYYYGGTPAASNQTTTTNSAKNNNREISEKNKMVALLLCLFLGFLGAHHFYVGKTGMGVLYIFTGGLFGIGWFVDLFKISVGSFKDSQGRYLVKDTITL